MQYKTLATLLFATAALAAPKPQDFSDSDYTDYSDYSDYDDIPTSIEAVISTAIPTTWLESFYTDEAFYSSEVAAMAKGDYPDWVSSMPSDARAWATSVLHEELSELTETDIFASATDSGSFPMYTPTLTGATATATASGSVTHLTGTKSSETTSTGTSDASTTTDSSESSSAGASSSAAPSSSSTGGAPAATGSLAMGIAGAAGILGVALAL